KNKIIIGNWYMAEHAGCNIQIHNLTGKLVLQQQMINKSRQTEIDISYLKPGVYMVSLWHKSSLIGREKLMVID
ncbi:MAG: T9SS type A sorting domain-containing protein, partial [Bacteroidales bacterium]|nr:T9SS type A sorting domain-containing protein [Bacteroidales bacterium]MCF8351784.1 T9SS type A sorting domain-containing protein [Bacteroidales bacterium]MCF8377352.1 T9SS type A sorting domain-containing protein [Bacteroidales bacterium]MCF8401387.1 T9SS type A sorting domain-containing protein [Bacteroidales bacterium]